MEDKSSKDVEAGVTSTADVSAYVEKHDDKPTILSFAIEEHERNTADNPHRENTSLAPVLIRKVDSAELLPLPFKTTNQLLVASYLSGLCCLGCAVCAINQAWRAKEKRNNGPLSSAADEAKSARRCITAAVVFGAALWILGVVLAALRFSGKLS